MKKYNLLIPIAGNGQRFVDAGYPIPKPIILVNRKLLIDLSLSSINTSECNIIFVVRSEHISNFHIDEVLKKTFGNDIQVVVAKHLTQGAVSSCLLAKEEINNDLPLIIFTSDVYFEKQFNPAEIDFNTVDGLVLTFKSNSPNYSYVSLENGFVNATAEKLVISNNAAVGVYCFSKGKTFIEYAEKMVNQQLKTNNEFYICPLYNLLIKDGLKIQTREVKKMYVFGTPDEMQFYLDICSKKFGDGIVGLCSDHSGYITKEKCKTILDGLDIDFIDFGSYVDKDCDQVDYTKLLCKAIVDKRCSFGLGFCRTGQAINISANKIKGIRAGLIFDEYTAEYAIRHNGINFASISEKYALDNLQNIIQCLKDNTFDGGRHQIRVQKIEVINGKA